MHAYKFLIELSSRHRLKVTWQYFFKTARHNVIFLKPRNLASERVSKSEFKL